MQQRPQKPPMPNWSGLSKNLGEPMVGRNVSQMPEVEKIAGRGW